MNVTAQRLAVPLIAAVMVAGVLLLSLFTVDEQELAVRTRFGQVEESGYAPGLHWSWPFEHIVHLDRRVLTARLQGESFLTSEQQGLLVDIDLTWRIRDPRLFLHAGQGDEQAVTRRLAEAVRSELKGVYAQWTMARVVAAPRGGISAGLLERVRPLATAFGVELVDVRVKRIDPAEDVANSIYARMQEAYVTQTRQVRAAATAEADRIRAEAERNRAAILAAANRDAQRVRGEADAQAAGIRARAYGANVEFAAFYRTLQAYRNALVRDGDILVIEPEGAFYKYLRNPARH
jgi:modulator of FtsH protease HflC